VSHRRVYLSHGYKAEDRTVNEFFWASLRSQFYAWIDTGVSDLTGERLAMDVAFNEWMLSQCDGFVAIIRNRVSQYQHLEYRLASRLKLPALIFLEEPRTFHKMSHDTRVVYPPGWKRFFADDKQKEIAGAIARFHEEVERHVAARAVLRSAGHWCRPDDGLKVALLPPTPLAWESAAEQLRHSFKDAAEFKTLHPSELLSEFHLLEAVADCHVVVLDVGPRGTPTELIGFLHGIGIPQIRVCQAAPLDWQMLERTLDVDRRGRAVAARDDESDPSLPRFLDGYRIDRAMTPVGFWSEQPELAEHVERTLRRIVSFQNHVHHRLEDRRQARTYFGLRYPQPPRANVFLSFAGASKGTAATNDVAKALRLLGFDCFHYQDRELTGRGRLESGEFIEDGLRMRVEESDIVVAFLDREYLNSPFCRNELESATNLDATDELILLPYSIAGLVPPPILAGRVVHPFEGTTWDRSVVVETIVEAVERAADALNQMSGLDAQQLSNWLRDDQRSTPEDLHRPLIQAGADQEQVRAWTSEMPKSGWEHKLLESPTEGAARQRHRELLTLLLLSLADERPARRELIHTWLRTSKLLTWSGLGQPKSEAVEHVSEPALGAKPPSDPSLLGELLGRTYAQLLKGKGPLCLEADAKTLVLPLEIAREGTDAEPLGMLRPVRWRLADVPTRESLHELRASRGLPPSSLLLTLQSPDLAQAERETRQLEELLAAEYLKRDWPRARVLRPAPIESAEQLLRVLSTTPHGIVHLAGHAGPDGVRVGAERVDAARLALALSTSEVRLLVINGCSAADARSALATGTISLVDLLITRGHVPEIVAHRDAVYDDDAIDFARRFYLAFLRDLDLGRAVHEARIYGSERLRRSLVAVSQRHPIPPARAASAPPARSKLNPQPPGKAKTRKR
jgi:hypothetical protein